MARSLAAISVVVETGFPLAYSAVVRARCWFPLDWPSWSASAS